MISGMAVLELRTTSVDLCVLCYYLSPSQFHGSFQTMRQRLALEDWDGFSLDPGMAIYMICRPRLLD